MTMRSRRVAAAVLLSTALLAACGLKPEVKNQLAQAGGGAGGIGSAAGGANDSLDAAAGDAGAGGTTGTGGTGTGSAGTGSAGTGSAGTGSAAAGGTGGGAGATGGGGRSGGGAGGAGGAAQAPQPGTGNTTGIDFKNKTIKVILHGPLTGAGVPQESFRTGGPKYWEKSGPGGGPRLIAGGFRVIADAVDDKYNAADALRACNQAASEAFLIIGGAGTDQIQACAQSQVLRRGNVPYLSSGVTETGLGGLPNYFATSLTYKQQSPLVISMARDNRYLANKWAVVITGTPNFADARDSIAAALNGAKGEGVVFDQSKDIILTEKAPSNCVDVGNRLRAGQYGAVYFLGQPLFFGLCVNQYPTAVYTGPGPSFGIQSVADLACRGSLNYRGFYLHPSPEKNLAQQKAQGAPPFNDDIEAGIWGAMQSLEQAFGLVQGPLSRESFIAALARAGTPGGVLAPSIFNGQTRFGGTAAYANKITCNPNATGKIETIARYDKAGTRTAP